MRLAPSAAAALPGAPARRRPSIHALLLMALAFLVAGIAPSTASALSVGFLPPPADFGNVQVGQQVSRYVYVINTSGVPIDVAPQTGGTDPNYEFGEGFYLGEGGVAGFSVTFKPTETGDLSRGVTFLLTHGNDYTLTSLQITGRGTPAPVVVPTAPKIELSAPSVDLGDVRVDHLGTAPIVVKNTGNAPLRLLPSATSPFGVAANGSLTVEPGDELALDVFWTPHSRGTVTGSVLFDSNAAGPSPTVSVSGNGVAPELQLDPSGVDFGDVVLGTTATRTVKLRNTGNAPLVLPGVDATSGNFAFQANGATVDPGSSVDLTVTVSSTVVESAGPILGGAQVLSDGGEGEVLASANLVSPTPPPASAISVDKPVVDYGFQRPGPHPCPVTVKNTGDATLYFGEVSVGDGGGPLPNSRSAAAATSPIWWVEGSNAPLEKGETRVFTVWFSPTEPIAYRETLNIFSDAPGSPLQIPLKGSGQIGKLTGAPGSVAFGDVAVGAKLTKTVTIKNTGTYVTTPTASLTGAGAARYTVTGPTGALAINATRTYTITLAPTARGALAAANLVIGGNAVNAPVTVPLSGRGIAPVATVTPAPLAFGTVKLNASLAKTITVKNTGEGNLTFASAPKLAGTDAARFAVSGAITPLAAGASRVFTVTFKPTTKKGAHAASLTFATNSVPAPAAVALTGTGG